MGTKDRKIQIQEAITNFNHGSLFQNTIHFLKILGYESQKTCLLSPNSPQNFIETFDKRHKLDFQKALINNWLSVDFIFQLTEDEFKSQNELFRTNKFNPEEYQSYLFLVVELKVDHYSRGNLVAITREVNKIFQMPSMIFFKIGERITISIINRRPSKIDISRDVLEKVTLIKDINTLKPHRAHIEILFDLSFEEINRKHNVSNFLDLHHAWQKTLDSSELNKKFYKEISNWYFWSLKQVKFPADVEPKQEIRNPINVIRLITRLIFVWFLKEKGLVPDKLFNEKEMDKILNKIDKTGSTYYKAILQNLFFATLNIEMNKDKLNSRKFIERMGYHSQQHLMPAYRYERFFKNPDESLKLFENIPFLNGGLFENLDYEETMNGEYIIKRIDCFSDNLKNEIPLKVPDELFFGEERQVDLSKDYGDQKKRKETLKGIIHILNSYKFTVEENTPIEEEVALDPELLGKVFENLLASYNPETHTTARKQTGSFYTPREIVNYMVDESLIAYLENSLVEYYESQRTFSLVTPASQADVFGRRESLQMEMADKKVNLTEDQKNETNKRLRHLIAYNDLTHKFNEREVDVLIKAIDKVKILDPACGSGAFPMGMLQKLVYVLSKLDPNNEKWKQKQIEKLFEIEDSVIREKLVEDIEESFQNNELDYGRKLYLVENCIYGVDIQPIAVQIAKLRFFISLVIDQKIIPNQKNLGMRSLPNLETKFIAANTLIGLDKPSQIKIRNLEIEKLEKQLNKVRQQHFNASDRKEKQRLREQDEQLRLNIADLLIDDGWNDTAARQIAFWDPYNQNKSSEFFDPEWMFGIIEGFDVVISNPPYVRADNPLILVLRKKIINSKKFESLWEKWDLYVAFLERGFKLLSDNSVLEFIISDAYMHSKYSIKSQDFFLNQAKINRIDFCSNLKIFEAGIKNIIVEFQKAVGINNIPRRIKHFNSFGNFEILKSGRQKDIGNNLFKQDFQFKSDFHFTNCILWKEICYVSVGMVLNADEITAKGEFEKSDLISDKRDDIHSKKYIEAKWIEKYLLKITKYLEWNTKRVPYKVRRPTFQELYTPQKILMGGMTGAVIDEEKIVCNHSIIVSVLWKDLENVENKSIVSSIKKDFDKLGNLKIKRLELEYTSNEFSLKYLLSILNSKFGYYYLDSKRRSKLGFYPDDLKILPIKKLSELNQKAFIDIVDQIIFAKKNNLKSDILENKINLMIYKLYGLVYSEVKIIDPQFDMSEAEYNRLHFDFEDEISLEGDKQRKQIV